MSPDPFDLSEDLDPLSAVDVPLSTLYAYTLLGSLDRTDLPNGVIEDYEYDALNRLDVLTQYAPDGSVSAGSPDADLSNNARLAEFDYEVRADGKRTATTETFWLDTDSNPGTAAVAQTNRIDWTYDAVGRLTDELFNHFDDDLDRIEQFVYDLTGNRVEKRLNTDPQFDTGGNALDTIADELVSYLYDANDRLTEERQYTPAPGSLEGWDKDDGVLQRTTAYGYDHTQQTAKTVTDSSGSMLSTVGFAYDLQGRMSEVTNTDSATGKVTVTSFDYDTSGIRVASTHKIDAEGDGTFESQVRTEYLVDHANFTGYQQAIKETHTDLLTGNVTKTVEYTFGHDEIAQTVQEFDDQGQVTNDQTLVFGHDGHGSVRVLFDTASAILQLYSYTAYGEMLGIHDAEGTFLGADEALALTTLLYSGEPYMQQIAMQYLRARFYDAEAGRFNRLDDFSGRSDDPQSFHKYLYTHGDPVNGIDPTGMFGDFSLIGFLSNFSLQGQMRTVSQSSNLSTLRTAQQAHKLVKMFQQVIKIMDKVTDVYELATDIVDLLSLDPGDFKDLFFKFQPIRNAALGALAAGPPIVAKAKLPDKVIKKLGKIGSVLGTSDRMQEIIGEFGTALIIKLMGFEVTTMKMDSRHGPDTLAMHKSSGVWGVFESKGGSSKLGTSTLGGSVGSAQQMGAKWISYWVPRLLNMNVGHDDEADLRTKFTTFQPMVAVVTRLNLKLKRDHIKAGLQVYIPPTGPGMNPWQGF